MIMWEIGAVERWFYRLLALVTCILIILTT